MRLVNELILQLKQRGDDLSLETAAKLERQAELLEAQYSHERELYRRIHKKAQRVVRNPTSEAIDDLRTELNEDV